MISMNQRYVIVQRPGQQQWAIFDRHLRALCSLPGQPLRWGSRADAEGWLYRCRVVWRSDLVDAPEGWARAA